MNGWNIHETSHSQVFRSVLASYNSSACMHTGSSTIAI